MSHCPLDFGQFYNDHYLKTGEHLPGLKEEDWVAPDLSMFSNRELVQLLGTTGTSDHWSDKKFADAVRTEIRGRKPTVS